MANVELTLPGSVLVNARGRRFVNEATNYHDLNKAFRTIDSATGTHAHIPAWMVVDSAYVARYSIGGTPAGTAPAWTERGDTVEELAQRCGVDPAGLAATLAEFNRHAADGRDPHFHRGESAQDRHLGDATRPHPCLAPLEQGPYYAIPIRPGTLGTCGGLVTDDDGRVLDRRGRPIRGLYAAGNVGHRVRRRVPRWGCDAGVRDHAGLRRRARARPSPIEPEHPRGLDMALHAVIYRYADERRRARRAPSPPPRPPAQAERGRPPSRQRPAGRRRRARRAPDLPRGVPGAGRAVARQRPVQGARADRGAGDPGLEPGLRRRSARLTGPLDRDDAGRRAGTRLAAAAGWARPDGVAVIVSVDGSARATYECRLARLPARQPTTSRSASR